MDSERVIINGYSFDQGMGVAAKKEKTAIGVISRKLDMDKPETVLKVYKQIISQKLFHTQVGYDFLKGLQNYLITNPEINNDEIECIEIDSPEESLEAINHVMAKTSGGNATSKAKKAEDGKYKKRAKIFMSTTIILIVCVVMMFAITLTANVPTIVNYKSVLNDQYSQWEQSLTEKENRLMELEKQLNGQTK